MYPLIVARQRLSKHVPSAIKNCWRYCFLYGSCRIKVKRPLVLPRTSCLVIENPPLGLGALKCAAAEQEVGYGVAYVYGPTRGCSFSSPGDVASVRLCSFAIEAFLSNTVSCADGENFLA
jgi:hypothetical protein